MKNMTFFSYNIAIKLFNIILIFLSYFFLEKIEFKLFAFYLSISNYIIFLINSSINNTSSVKNYFNDRPFSLYIIKIILLLLFLPAIIIYAISTNNFKLNLFLLSILFASTSIANFDFYFKGKEINKFQKIQFYFSFLQIIILISCLYFKFNIDFIFTFFCINSICFLLLITIKNKFRFEYIKNFILYKFIFSLFLINLLNLLYYNLDVILSFYLKDPELFKDFFIWTRVFSIITVLATIFSDYFSNKIFINDKPNNLESKIEKFYISGIYMFFILILCSKYFILNYFLFYFPDSKFINASYTVYYLAIIPITFIGPLFGYNLLHYRKQKQLINLTFVGIILYLFVYLVLTKIFFINILVAISIAFMFSKILIETSIIYLNYHYNIISLKLFFYVSILIFTPILLVLI
jgi:hypothetical protein